MQSECLLTSKQAADVLQIHPKTLQRYARRGTIPGIRIGDLWRFRASDLDQWIGEGVSSERHSCRN